MIPASDVIIDGDTAWLVVSSDIGARTRNRPCDACGDWDTPGWNCGTPYMPAEPVACSHCSGTGRHTFTIDIEGQGVRQIGNLLSVHVLEVLPIAAPGMFAVHLAIHKEET